MDWTRYQLLEKQEHIDLVQVATLLGAHKSSLMATLKNSYVENVDFTVEKKKVNSGRGGALNKVVMVRNTCFKRLCIQSRSENARQLRERLIVGHDSSAGQTSTASGHLCLGGIVLKSA